MNQYECSVGKTITDSIAVLDQAITKAKCENRIDINSLYLNQYEYLTASIRPENGDYQNFGVMQALDHLYVLSDLIKSIEFDKGNIIAFGSSQGGYIANLMAKFAPNTFSAVLDNSSYAFAPLVFILGRQLGLPEYWGIMSENIHLGCFVISPWRLNHNEKNYFSRDRQKIRSFLFEDDIKTMAKIGKNKTQYRIYHSRNDGLAKIDDKIQVTDLLQKNGFDVQISIMDQKKMSMEYL